MTDLSHPARDYTDALKTTFETPPVTQSPVTKTHHDGTAYRLYNLLESTYESAYGMYVLTAQSDNKRSETITQHGKIGAEGTIPNAGALGQYIEDDNTVTLLKENFRDGDLHQTLRNHSERKFREVFGEIERNSMSESDVQITGQLAFIPSDSPNFPSGHGGRHIGTAAWDAYQQYIHDTFGDVLDDEFEGVHVRLTFDDWREMADDLAFESTLSRQQSVAWAIAQQGFNGSQIADLLDKDSSTISRQLSDASEKFVQAKSLVNLTESVPVNLSKHVDSARKDIENRIREREHERSKKQVTGPYRCPECGRDAGGMEGDSRGYDMDSGTEFIRGMAKGSGAPIIICPECDASGSEGEFISEWEDEHGSLPEPPHPEPPTRTRLPEPSTDPRR